MTLRNQQRLLRIVGATLLLASGTIAYAALLLAPWETRADERGERKKASERALREDEETTPPDNPQLWKRPLRRPLYDPPPPPPPKVVKKVLPPLRSTLLGTIIEPGASQAMINIPGKGVEFRSQGDPLGPHDQDAVLIEIGPHSVKVARGDEITELQVESPY